MTGKDAEKAYRKFCEELEKINKETVQEIRKITDKLGKLFLKTTVIELYEEANNGRKKDL